MTVSNTVNGNSDLLEFGMPALQISLNLSLIAILYTASKNG
jgi:hypothetical protein